MAHLHSLPMPSELSDEDLVARFRAGDAAALDVLVGRHRHVARGKARRYFLLGADIDDVEQEGMIGLFKAAMDYQPELGSYRAFAEVCVTRQLLSAIKGASRHKHQPLNRYTSLSGGPTADGEEADVEALLDDRRAADPVDAVVSAEQVEALRLAIDEVLSGLETEVLGRFVEGCSYEEIGADLGRRPKAVDNALQRIRRKLSGRLDQAA